MKNISVRSLILMNISALFGIRWIAKSTSMSSGMGLGAIPMWILFTLIFFVPGALICAEFASRIKTDDGMVGWIRETLGENWAFQSAWLTWTARLFWYASFITFLVVNIAYAIGQPGLVIGDNSDPTFILKIGLPIFIILSLMGIKGMSFGKVFTSLSAFSSTIPAILLIILGFFVVFTGKVEVANEYTVKAMTPNLTSFATLGAISSIMFALAGAEVTANFVNEMDNPKKNYPKAILIAAAIVAVIYVLGSIAITLLLPVTDITSATGILDAFVKIGSGLGIGDWFARIIAVSIALSMLGAILLYSTQSVKLLFGTVPEGIFPKSITKTNKVGIPTNAVIFQVSFVSLILIGVNLSPSISAFYDLLITLTALSSLFPYMIIFYAYIKMKSNDKDGLLDKKENFIIGKTKQTGLRVGWLILVVTMVGIILSLSPWQETLPEILVYEAQLIGGSILIVLSGYLLYSRYSKKSK